MEPLFGFSDHRTVNQIELKEQSRRQDLSMQPLMKYSQILLVILLLTMACSPHPLKAATLFQQVGISSPPLPVGSGARAMGMAGAFIAVADDATAASWNPGGMIQVEKPELSVVGAFSQRNNNYFSDTPAIDTTATDEAMTFNYCSATLPIQWHKNVVLSINYQRLYDFQRSLKYELALISDQLQLDQKIQYSQKGFVGAVGLSGAIALTSRLSLGGTINIWTDELGWDNGWSSSYQLNAKGVQADVPLDMEAHLDEVYEKFRGINFNIGLLWETPSWGTLGAVIKTPFKASIVHRYKATGATTYGSPINITLTNDPLDTEEVVSLYMPMSYGLGWSHRFSDRLTLSFDLYHTAWEDYKLVDSKGNAFSPIDGRLKDQSNVEATNHVRMGMEYLVLRPQFKTAWPLRAGIFYDPEPTEGDPQDYFGIALGAGMSRPHYSLDVAYQLRWARDVDAGNLINGVRTDAIQHSALLSLIFYL